jgi:hypothetical protein
MSAARSGHNHNLPSILSFRSFPLFVLCSEGARLARASLAIALNNVDSVQAYFEGKLSAVDRPAKRVFPPAAQPASNRVPFRLHYELATS